VLWRERRGGERLGAERGRVLERRRRRLRRCAFEDARVLAVRSLEHPRQYGSTERGVQLYLRGVAEHFVEFFFGTLKGVHGEVVVVGFILSYLKQN
jgi:hypothetical protein